MRMSPLTLLKVCLTVSTMGDLCFDMSALLEGARPVCEPPHGLLFNLPGIGGAGFLEASLEFGMTG